MTKKLKAILESKDIPHIYRDTPAGTLLEYHNLNKPFDVYKKAALVIGTCMDNRISLRIPKNFAFVIRSGGGNLMNNDFYISFAIAVGEAKCITVIGHNKCGMSNIPTKKETFINNLVEHAGWNKTDALQHFEEYSQKHEIGDEVDFVLNETNRLREMYPKIKVVPMMYLLEDHKLYLVGE